MKKFCIVLAGQRTGSTGLGRGLAQLADFRWVSEIFHSDFADPAIDLDSESDIVKGSNFFNFRYYQCRLDPTLTMPSEMNQKYLFQEYLKFLENRFDKRGFIIDIKYNSWHHLNTYDLWPESAPFLLKMVCQAEFPILHLIRENLFAQYCSHELAIKSNRWQRLSGEAQITGTLTLDLKEATSFMNQMERQAALFQSFLVGYEPYHVLKYEEIFEDDHLSNDVVQYFSELFSCDPKRQAPIPVKKATPHLSKVVENISEVLEYFKETKYDEMVRKSLLN